MTNERDKATVTCAECGLVGHMEHVRGTKVLNTFLDGQEFRRLCKHLEPGPAADCTYWDEAQRAAVAHLGRETKH